MDMMEINKRYDELMAGGDNHYNAMHKIIEEMNKPQPVPLEKMIDIICTDAWKQEGNTTMNHMVGWIMKKVFPLVLEPLDKELELLKEQYNELYFKVKELENGKAGRVSQPQGSKSTKSPRNGKQG
jgi:hypothetical protein